MNSIEFKKVLEKFNIQSITGSVINYDGAKIDIYSWRGIDISFSGSDSYPVFVKGYVPYEVARILFKKYPDYRDDVRIYGKIGDKKNYPKDEMGNTFVDYYNVYSIEGLVYLLSEIKYFYEVRTYTEKSRKAFYREQKEIIASIYRELIEEVNLNYSTKDWKKDHHISDDDEYDEIRELVSQFDETINPYINFEVEVKVPNEFIDKVKMSFYYRQFKNFQIDIEGKGGKAVYSRDFNYCENKAFLRYLLDYYVDPNNLMIVDHVINDEYDEIRLYSFQSDHTADLDEIKIDLCYDMKSGLVHSNNNEDHHPITEEEKQLFIDELNKALKVGEKLILNPMTKKKKNLVKKLS